MNLYWKERKCKKEENLLYLILGFSSIHHQGELFFFLEIKTINENSVNVEEFDEVCYKKM